MWTEIIGWASASILLLTIANQVHKQWREPRTEGISKLLFVGQILASAGFTIYSYLVDNWVFVVTNALILLSALIGEALFLRNRARQAKTP